MRSGVRQRHGDIGRWVDITAQEQAQHYNPSVHDFAAHVTHLNKGVLKGPVLVFLHATTRTAPAMLAQSLAVLDTIKSKLWDDAVPEQRKLTLQLARNTLYFTTAVFLIKQFGEQIAI